jgi:hypothetical protein
MSTTTFDHQRQAADDRREALNWLSRRLSWENRLGQLRPSAEKAEADTETKQAA